MSYGGLSMGSLCRWAKEDNIMEFNRITSENKKKLLIDSLSGTHTDVFVLFITYIKMNLYVPLLVKKVVSIQTTSLA